ncbi:unnamed protein product [Bursaphelenchus okinawaensis]|uniref:Uncharacterized protein n=1 Tax=Bursaphelenchus okinawaensis TaxID=465554 RepID=A0A811KJS0_9BILA|nr:unnamed protein product [Bursaphelenchus okinawaensis]CAG9105159.1 unnamed protein product [Bursaphelenchus okinawaensis]
MILKNKKASYGDEVPPAYQATKFGQLFSDYILNSNHCNSKDCQVNQDDMLWYVPMAKQPTTNLAVGQQVLQVFRRSSPNKPACFDDNVNWEETVCLNVILQQFDYYVTVAVCIRSQPNNLQILKKNCQRVYPSPSRRRMDVKGDCEEMTYPKIYFAIDNFETIFPDIVITENECVCVELVARDRFRDKEAVVFLGSIRFDVLKKLYDSRGNSTWTWAQKLVTATQRRHEFVKMRGPHGKGFAEMAVARVASLGFETPMSEHCFEMSGSYDSRWADQRRMSDTNIFGKLLPKRTALTPGPCQDGNAFSLQPRNRRWQSDADSMNNDSDFDVRSVVSETTSRPMTASQQADTGSKWSLNSFGNALSWLKEKKEIPALNAYLTYVTLPWRSIIDDMLLTSPRKPILTFDLDYLDQ